MIGYILNDFKRAIRSKGTVLYLIGTACLILLANIAVICFRFIYGTNEGTFSYNVFEYASWCFLIPYYSCILIAAIVVGKEYPDPEKSPLKPWQTYIAKLIASILLAAVFLVAAFVLLYAVTSVFHLDEGIIIWPVVKSFLSKACLSLPLWFAGISFAIMFLFVFRQRWKSYAGFAFVVFIIPQLIRVFSLDMFKNGFFRMIRRYTITQSFGLVPYPSYPERSVPLIITLGIVYGIIALIAGIVIYQKKAS
ncbi:MAG: hypothetical protein K6F73_09065 [Lachnospiraceae bacterium]|nr:hypothetical protein [Lachnospiraceae bacterium]